MTVDGAEVIRTTTPAAFRRLGLAILLIAVDLRWDGGFGFALDLLPDLLGWLLIILALQQIERLHPLVAALQVLGWMAMAVELLALVVGRQEGLAAVLDGGGAALFACFVWLLCQVVVDIGHYLVDYTLDQQARRRRIAFMALSGLATISPLWAPLVSGSAGAVVLVLLAAYFGAGILLMALMFSTAQAMDRRRKDLIRMQQGWVPGAEQAGAGAH